MCGVDMEFTQTWLEKKQEAIAELVRLGAIIKAKDSNLMYHGRSGDGSQWSVKSVDNSSNNTGNHNVYSVAGLYTASADIAREFANERARIKQGVPEVHKIQGIDDDAIIFNIFFNPGNLSATDRLAFNKAMEVFSSLTITRAKPIKFEYRNVASKVFQCCNRNVNQAGLVTMQGVDKIITELKKDASIKTAFNASELQLRQFVFTYVTAFNSRLALKRSPAYVLKHYKNGSQIMNINGEQYPISSEYISAWCSHNHVIGTKDRINSVTIDKEIDACHLFDTKRIASEKQNGERLSKLINTYGELSHSLEGIVPEDAERFLTCATSKEIMDCVCTEPKVKELFDKDSGIWEGWTVGQHTQSVMEFFDRYYKDEIPDSLKPFLKIALLSHDVGKGIALDKKISQTQANMEVSSILYDALGVSDKHRQLLDFVINDSQFYTSEVLKGTGTKSGITTACYQAYKQIFGKEPSTNEIEGLKNLCVMLQQCDSGAYTRYSAVPHQNGQSKHYVGGGNDIFTDSFVKDEKGVPRLSVFLDDRVK